MLSDIIEVIVVDSLILYYMSNKWMIVANLITVWLVNRVWVGAHWTKSKDPELLKKYPPFMRNDMHNWLPLAAFPTYLTYIQRLLAGLGLLTIYGILTKIIFIGADTEKVDPTRRWMIKKIGEFICRSILYVSTV